MTTVYIQFKTRNRFISHHDVIIFSFDLFDINYNQDLKTIRCSVQDTVTGLISSEWLGMRINTHALQNIQLFAKNNTFVESIERTLVCRYLYMDVATPAQLGIKVQNGLDSSFSIGTPKFLSITRTPVSSLHISTLQVTKTFDSYGSNMLMNIKLITASTLQITPYSQLHIIFPFYYLPKLSRDGCITCYLITDNYLQSTCTVDRERIITLKLFQYQYSNLSEFEVLISGITQPFVLQSQQIQVLYDSDGNFNEVDTIVSGIYDPLQIYHHQTI